MLINDDCKEYKYNIFEFYVKTKFGTVYVEKIETP